MYSDYLIEVSDLCKHYAIYDKPHHRLKQFVLPRIQNFLRINACRHYQDFIALEAVSFNVRRGETIGVIGKNGSGKSTLLQIICGTLMATSGFVSARGRIAPLLELGSGFNMDFTGRENVFLYATLMGLTHEQICARFDEIAEFADIGQFMDQPLKTYSSGMVARLAFSVAVQMDPDILIVDEALSVGDMAFQEKSYTRMKEIRDAGTSILFVSHSLPAVRNFCEQVLLLDGGKVRLFGDRISVCDAYQNESESDFELSTRKNYHSPDNNIKDRTIWIVSVDMDKVRYEMGDKIRIVISLKFNSVPRGYGVGLIITDPKGVVVSIMNTLRDDLVFSEAKEKISLEIDDNHFAPGRYDVTVIVSDQDGMFAYDKKEHCTRFNIDMERSAKGLPRVEGVLRCDHAWFS